MQEELKYDLVKDGVIDFKDWAVLAKNNVDIASLAEFIDQWLTTGSSILSGDIAPAMDGDGIVDIKDLRMFNLSWLQNME